MKLLFQKRIFIPIIALALAGASYSAYRASLKSKPNVIVISGCSLRKDRLSIYNPSSQLTQKIGAWAKEGAFVFGNFISQRPWENFAIYSSDIITHDFLKEHGYRAIVSRAGFGLAWNIPAYRTTQGTQGKWYSPGAEGLSYKEELDKFKEVLRGNAGSPFYSFVQLKYLHYPYVGDSDQPIDQLSGALDETGARLLKTYSENKRRYPDKMSLITALFNQVDPLREQFFLDPEAEILSAAGVISSAKLDRAWQNSKGFTEDVSLLKQLYDIKMRTFDKITGEILELTNEPSLRNSVVIFLGDHGEAIMEHGILGHGVNVYEEMIGTPLAVKFPGSSASSYVQIPEQLSRESLVELVRRILAGEVNEKNFAEATNQLSQEYVLSRDCADSMRSVRFRNTWKLIQRDGEQEPELYHLAVDPGELKNVAAENPELVWQLEEYLLDHRGELNRYTHMENKAAVCGGVRPSQP